MQISSRRFLQVGVLIFVTIALALSAQAAGFSNASLKGGYSFLVNRWTADVTANQFAVMGVMTFDGAGNVTASYTMISGGSVTTGTLGGTYAVKSNGTGTIKFTTGTNPPQFAITLNSTAAGVAHGVQLLQTNDSSNEVVSGTALLQSTTAGKYSVANVKGNFGFQWNEWTADVNNSQEGCVGIVSFDGKGNLKGSQKNMSGGVLKTGTFTGTYTVNPDGSGSMSMTDNRGDKSQTAFALNSVAAGQAKGAQFLVTSTGGNNKNIVVSGVALKQ